MPLLELRDVHVRYGGIEAVKGITFEVDEGELVTLIGGNGAGKTTTLKTISGLKRPSEGAILFEGRPIESVPAHEIVDLGVCQAPEGRRIFPRMTVHENLEMGAYGRKDHSSVKDDYERVYTLFPVLRDRQKQKGGTLSGGEQQMLAIGRALMGRPRLLMLDEPSMGLAPLVVEKIFGLLREIHEQGTTILLVEQNAQAALRLADRGYVIESGEIVLTDEAKALLGNEQVRKAYLGVE
ncbi:MAG: branched-chain amino acid transport system ATP-binding protein [Actinomycetota bacterium]|jgi:branched-chain amino acid transport system ATP-binding protein|nr:branched-chain amino acid transport system ATP-binding protein [Actinomycetota bacterium]